MPTKFVSQKKYIYILKKYLIFQSNADADSTSMIESKNLEPFYRSNKTSKFDILFVKMYWCLTIFLISSGITTS